MNYEAIQANPVGNYYIRQVWTWGDIFDNKHNYPTQLVEHLDALEQVSELYMDQVGHCLDNYNNITLTEKGYQL